MKQKQAKNPSKKINRLGLCVLILSIIICVFAVSYAAWVRIYEGKKVNSIDTATLILTLDNSEKNAIDLTTAIPVSDNKGLTYVPYTLVTLHGALGWTLFGIVLGAAVLGIVLNSINLEKYKKMSMICYLVMGWAIIGAIKQIYNNLDFNGVLLLVLGGIIYTIGAVLYGVGKKVRYMHSVWHLFVLAGTILQFFSIYLYVL